MEGDRTVALTARVAEAAAAGRGLAIRGGGTKDFYGGPIRGELLETGDHRGVLAYRPTELVVTARAGTPLAEIEALLAESGQFLPFEPPRFAPGGTLGGAVAAGLSGPRRPYAGAVRDFLLGVTVLTGRAEVLRFGGEVVKNVAGFDLFRPMAGALGSLGVVLDISLKVLPRPAASRTVAFALEAAAAAVETANRLAGRPLPLAGAVHLDGRLILRLEGAPAAIEAALPVLERMAGPALPVADAAAVWTGLRDHTHDFFAGDAPLWRVCLPPAAPPLAWDGPQLIDWGGAQRWLRGAVDADDLRRRAAALGGHVTLFRGGDGRTGVFPRLAPAVAAVEKRLRAAFDPAGIFNRGRSGEA
jgi:glycolate oxidase FAD binding subunit